MKKLLLIAAATAALSTSAMADVGGFYLRGDTGAFFNTKQKVTVGTDAGESNLKLKSKAAALLDLGFGYNVDENFRAEVVYTHLFNPQLKGSKTIGGEAVSLKSKGKVDALMVKGVFDAYDFGAGKVFLVGGVGISQVSEKVTFSVDDDSASTKLKKKKNFAYTLGFGSSFNVAEGVDIDAQYAWADYGKAKHVKSDDGADDSSKIKRRGHALKVGVRFAI